MFYKNAPFFIVMLASILPWFAAAADSKTLTYFPDGLAVIVYMVFALHNPRGYKIHPYFAIVFLLVTFHLCFGVITGRGIGSGGLASLFVLTFIFKKLLDHEANSASAVKIVWQISLIYILHIMFLLAELLVRLAGYTDVLVAFAGHPTEVMRFKTYNSAAFLHFLGFDYVNGMNSLLLGSQTASMLALFSAFWFAPLYRKKGQPENRPWAMFWFTFSVVLFPFVASMTAMFILALFIILVIYVLPNSVLNKRRVWIMLPILAVTFSGVLIPLFTYRITSEAAVGIYMSAFMDAPRNFLALPLIDQIMGFGRNIKDSPIEAADFGLAMLTYQSGVYLVGLALICLILMTIKVMRVVRQANKSTYSSSVWAMLAGSNMLLAIGWAVSLVHYTPAVELGGKQIFALHLAVSLVAANRLKMMRYMAQVVNTDIQSSGYTGRALTGNQ
jgi:hypothetical protein